MRADSLSGRCAVITGASRGIGAAIAARLADAGAETVLIGRDANALAGQTRRIPDSQSVICDVTDAVQVEKTFADLLAKAPIDILVNNAGAAESAPLSKTSDAMLERLMLVNRHGRKWYAECPSCHEPTLNFSDGKNGLRVSCGFRRILIARSGRS